MQGGTFTISNGGVYGSLMSTPILNAPQSGILGMHKIQERPWGRRQDRGAADDVSGALLRPPHRRRPRGGDVPGAGEGIVRGSRRGWCWISRSNGLRPHRHRHRPGRLCLRDPRRAARHESRGGREGQDLRRHLPQRRLHPVEGAAPRVASCSRRPATISPDGHQGVGAEARSRRDDEIQGRGRRRQRQRRRVPVQEEQDRCLHRPRHASSRRARSR